LLHFFEKRIGEMLTGIVWGVKQDGLVVRGIEIPVDGMVPLDRLPQDRYRYDRDTHTLEGYRTGNQFRLGDELIVRVERVDLARRHLEFRLEKVTHHTTASRSESEPARSNRRGIGESSKKGKSDSGAGRKGQGGSKRRKKR
jgi:ribonuclease R